jgi:hypothetical protein
MTNTQPFSTTAFTYEVTVQADGRVELTVPFTPGKKVLVVILQAAPDDTTFDDLLGASTTSTAFWDNPMDDEDWNGD